MRTAPVLICIAIASGAAWWWIGQGIDAGDDSPAPTDAAQNDSPGTYLMNLIGVTTQEQIDNRNQWLPTIQSASADYGLPDGLLDNLCNAESSYLTGVINGTTKSSAGAIGICQFEPATARQFGIDATDPAASINAAAEYLSQLYTTFGSWPTAVAAYNWGEGNVQRKGLAAAPRATVKYVKEILGVDITQGA